MPSILRQPLWDLGPYILDGLVSRYEPGVGTPRTADILAAHGIDPGPYTSSAECSVRGPDRHQYLNNAVHTLAPQSWHRDGFHRHARYYIAIWANEIPTLLRWAPNMDRIHPHVRTWETTLTSLGVRRYKRDNGLVHGKPITLQPGHLYLFNNDAFEHRGPAYDDIPDNIDRASIQRWFVRMFLMHRNDGGGGGDGS